MSGTAPVLLLFRFPVLSQTSGDPILYLSSAQMERGTNMIYQTFEITALGETAKLVTYIRSQAHLAAPEPWPLVLVIPGGGCLALPERY